jgi:hypothetical protein
VLQACVDRPAEWKQRYGFPADVQQVLGPEPHGPGQNSGAPPARNKGQLLAWQRIIVDRPEKLLALLLLVPTEDGFALHTHAVRQDGWVVQPEPALTLTTGWQEPFPELLEEPAPAVWRQAWRQWCQPRGLMLTETDTCPLERVGHRLRVELSSRVVDRLRSARSDALKGEAWLLAGEGRTRTAAVLEIVETRQGAAPPQA